MCLNNKNKKNYNNNNKAKLQIKTSNFGQISFQSSNFKVFQFGPITFNLFQFCPITFNSVLPFKFVTGLLLKVPKMHSIDYFQFFKLKNQENL